METATEYKVDKSTWGPGEWQAEPDRVDFIAHGFACLALRHPEHGHFCGYVAVPREHPFYGKGYDDIDANFHRGLTYAARCDGARVCHVPAPGMPDDVWWIGGDFGHVWDRSPGFDARLRQMREAAPTQAVRKLFSKTELERMTMYRALPYVREQIEDLARQLYEAA